MAKRFLEQIKGAEVIGSGALSLAMLLISNFPGGISAA